MGEEEGQWDLSVQIEGLSLRLRGLRLGSRVPTASADPPSPSDSLASFTLVPHTDETRSAITLTRVHSAAGSSEVPVASPNPSQPVPPGFSSPASSRRPLARPQVIASASSSASAVPEYPLSQRPRVSDFQARQSLAASFPVLPDSCLALCSSLTGSELSARERAERSWLAGCWAGAVLRNQVSRPDPSPALGLSSRYYCILRVEGQPAPIVVSSLAAFRRVVGTNLGDSVTHGFPSVAECRVYFSGAQLPYPASLTR